MKKLIFTLLALVAVIAADAKTLVVYYSYTNNVERIVTELCKQIDADVAEIEPAEKGLDYAADNYAIGSAQIAAIRNNPDDASSYPAIDPVNVNLEDYDCIIIGAPLWWSNMAAPLQTYLFHNGSRMAGKKIGLIVSSASSGISGVEADARRLISGGDFLAPSLWIRSSQTSSCQSMISDWLRQIDYTGIASGLTSVISDRQIKLEVNRQTISVAGDFKSFALFTFAGVKIAETSGNQIDAAAITNGIYLVSINTGDRLVTEKIILTK